MPISRLSVTSCVGLELRPLPSTGVTRLRRYYGPLRHPEAARPVPRGRPVEGHAPSPPGVSRVALISVYRHAVVITPVARWVLIARGTAYSNRFPASPAAAAFPVLVQGRRPHWSFRGLLDVHSRYGLSARRVAKRPVCLEGSDGFVTSTAAPIATGWSDPVAGWELHPLKTNTFPRRTPGLTPRSRTMIVHPVMCDQNAATRLTEEVARNDRARAIDCSWALMMSCGNWLRPA